MTATTLSHLPLHAGSLLVSAAGRGLGWVASRYARAPLANTAILALTVFTVMAGTNALYLQHGRHPAPLFGPATGGEGLPPTAVVTPVPRPATLMAPIVVIDETKSTAPTPRPIGNTVVVDIQRKLTQMGFYEGKVDGVYGPKTAGAIKRFQQRIGMPATGEVTDDVVNAISSAPLVLPQAQTQPVQPQVVPTQPVVVQPLVVKPLALVEPQATTPVATAEITGSIPPADVPLNPAAPEETYQPLEAPVPLAADATNTRAHRQLPQTPREALNIAVATVKDGVDALASVIENGPQLGPTPRASVAIAAEPATASIAIAPAPAPIAQPMPPIVDAAPTAPDPVVVADIASASTTTPMPATNVDPASDRELVAKVQRGLTSLGFLRGEIDGVAGEATAKAIRNFEVYYNYEVTGRVSPSLVNLLVTAGAQI